MIFKYPYCLHAEGYHDLAHVSFKNPVGITMGLGNTRNPLAIGKQFETGEYFSDCNTGHYTY